MIPKILDQGQVVRAFYIQDTRILDEELVNGTGTTTIARLGKDVLVSVGVCLWVHVWMDVRECECACVCVCGCLEPINH